VTLGESGGERKSGRITHFAPSAGRTVLQSAGSYSLRLPRKTSAGSVHPVRRISRSVIRVGLKYSPPATITMPVPENRPLGKVICFAERR